MSNSKLRALALIVVAVASACDDKKGAAPAPAPAASSGIVPAQKTAPSASSTAAAASSGAPSAEVPSGPSTTLEAACAAHASALCEMLDKCAHPQLLLSIGELPRCKERWKAECIAFRTATGSNASPATIDACREAMTASCDALLSGNTPPECAPKGSLSIGAGCIYDAQCASLDCDRAAPSDTCGKCAEPPKEGAACPKYVCAPGLSCASSKCRKPAKMGEACVDGDDCASPLLCFSGKCVAGKKLGESCDTLGKTAPDCDQTLGLFCPMSAGSVCKPVTIAKLGEPCVGSSDESKACIGGTMCGKSDKCEAVLADGAACDPKSGPSCDSPSRCVSGKCALPDATACK